MRRPAALLATLFLSLSPAIAVAQSLTAPLGQAVRLPVRGLASDVVVGDPKIADVTVVSPTTLFVSGKAAGATNLIVLDRDGRTLFSGRVLVPQSDAGQVMVQRGREAAGVFCAPTCAALPGANMGSGGQSQTAGGAMADAATGAANLPGALAAAAPMAR